MVYSLEERTEIGILYGIANRNDFLAVTLFIKNHPNRNVYKNDIRKMFAN